MAVYTLGTHDFPSMSAATEHLHRLLSTTQLDTQITGDDHDLLRALVEAHPERSEKVGVGVDHFVVRRLSDPRRKDPRVFFIVRRDGTTTTISYRPHRGVIPRHTESDREMDEASAWMASEAEEWEQITDTPAF